MYTTSVLYAVFTMIRSRPVSCTYCHIFNLSITTITLCIAQKNVCFVINLTIMISHAIIESCILCYFLTCFCCLRYLVLGILGPRSPSISLIPCWHRESTEDEIHLHNQGCLCWLVNFMFEQFFQTFLKIRDKLLRLILTKTFQL